MENKRRRVLTDVVGMGGISDRSLAKVLNFVRDNPEAIEKEVKPRDLSNIALQNLRQAGECTHSFALKDGTPFQWPFLSLRRVMPWLCDRCPAFATILEKNNIAAWKLAGSGIVHRRICAWPSFENR